MHPHGLPAEDCPDWEEGYRVNIPNDFPPMPPDVRRMVELEYQRELKRMKRFNRIDSIIRVFLIVAVVLNWISVGKQFLCF